MPDRTKVVLIAGIGIGLNRTGDNPSSNARAICDEVARFWYTNNASYWGFFSTNQHPITNTTEAAAMRSYVRSMWPELAECKEIVDPGHTGGKDNTFQNLIRLYGMAREKRVTHVVIFADADHAGSVSDWADFVLSTGRISWEVRAVKGQYGDRSGIFVRPWSFKLYQIVNRSISLPFRFLFGVNNQ